MTDRHLPAVIRPATLAALRHELELAEGMRQALAPSCGRKYMRAGISIALKRSTH